MFIIHRHHEHGAVSIYNSVKITVKNCTFHNNTSDSYFTRKPYQGSAGGLSISYHYPVSRISLNNADILIANCTFTHNSAVPSTRLKITSTEALIQRLFPGRGGGLILLVNTNSTLNFVFNDSIVMNNVADTFGGGVYCLTQRGHINQTYMFANIIFMNNTGPVAGGLSFINLVRQVNFIVDVLIYNCTFVGNTAIPKAAGATGVYSLLALPNNIVVFKECSFFNNTALTYGGAIDIASYNFFNNIERTLPVEYINWLVCS